MANKRKSPDKSPENDIGKAIDLLRSARAKCIRAGNETRASRILESIGQLENMKAGS